MKSLAIVVHETGGPEVLRLEPRELEEPGAGEVGVHVTAVGVNFIDIYFRTGLYPQALPFAEGLEGAGVVESLGPGVASFARGDRVAWASVLGSYAERIVAPASNLVRIPDGVSDAQAAAAMLQGMTAHYLAHATRQTRPGDVALVHAAAGGVGLLLVQMLKASGARVLATCSTTAKRALAAKAGADAVIRYDEANVSEAVRELTDGRGVDVVYDGVGRATFDASLASLRPRGLLVLFGQSSGPVPLVDLNRLNPAGSLFVTRPSLAHYTASRSELEERSGAVLGEVARGALQLRIGAEFPLAEAADAHRALEGRETTGKVLLYP